VRGFTYMVTDEYALSDDLILCLSAGLLFGFMDAGIWRGQRHGLAPWSFSLLQPTTSGSGTRL
jgi:hypothetical protein